MKTFCVAPWFARDIDHSGRDSACCLLPITHDIEKIRQAQLQDQWPEECSKCQKLEAAGQKSDRQIKNSTLDFYWDRDIEQIRAAAAQGPNEVRMLTLTTSTVCNAQCVTCGPHYSSSWRRAERNNFLFPANRLTLEDIESRVDLAKLITLSFAGGEPLYERRNFEILARLLELGNDRVFVSMVTNGSVNLSSHQQDILRQFKNLNFCLSIDGTEELFEYIRYPLRWNQLNHNIDFLRTITDNISASYTISNLNIFAHEQTQAWFKSNNIPFNHNIVYSPEYFQPWALPPETLKDADQELIGNNSGSSELFKECIAELTRQDAMKGMDFKESLPDKFLASLQYVQ